MRKSMAVISAFIIGTGSFSSEMAVRAAQNEDKAVETDRLLEETGSGISKKESLFGKSLDFENELDFVKDCNLLKESGIEYPGKSMDLFNMHGQKPFMEDLNSQKDKEKETDLSEKNADHVEEPAEDETEMPENREQEVFKEDRAEIKDLQIPQKLEVVIDPWEMDGKEQIYSDQYTIRNTGETAGVLTLSGLSCRPRENSSTVIRTDKIGLHDNKEKSVYMEMLFRNGDHVVLSKEGTEYKAELEPGEEMTFCFTGEVNEYAEEGWKKGDIAVGVVYSWDEKVAPDYEDVDGTDQEKGVEETKTDDMEIEETKDLIRNTETGEENPFVNGKEYCELNLPNIDVFIRESDENEEKQIKTVDLQMIQKARLAAGSWSVEENGQGSRITSEEYVLKNDGEEAGILRLSDLACKTGKESGLMVTADKNELYRSGERSVYVEMALGDGTNIILSQESSEYQVELKPGEELAVRFAGEMNESAKEGLEEGTVLVTAVCTWNLMVGK